MPIPEQQLETWSHQGAVATSRDTRASIYNALKGPSSRIAHLDIEVYLQGSYGNSTNIWASSDVDVVVQLNSTYFYDFASLSPLEAALFQLNNGSPATYRWEDFREDVLRVLKTYYGTAQVEPSNKCLKVSEAQGRMPADVIPALLFKKFTRYQGPNNHEFVPGIAFLTQGDRRLVVNYPKQHRDNGEHKNTHRTNGWFKPLVRIFKNARRRAVEEHLLGTDVAPSYFLECFIYNMPDHLFGTSFQSCYCNLLEWAQTQNPENFWCQNGQAQLFGSTPEQWTKESASRFMNAMIQLWNDW